MPSYGSSVSYHTALVTVAFLEAKLQHFVFLPHSLKLVLIFSKSN